MAKEKEDRKWGVALNKIYSVCKAFSDTKREGGLDLN